MLDHLLPQRTRLRVQNPLSQEPTAELSARGVVHVRPAGLRERSARGLCEPDQRSYFTPKRGAGLVFFAESTVLIWTLVYFSLKKA
jgi:hypothetical protein